MRRGDVWWADFGERRPVVLLSGDEVRGFRAMQIVPAAGVDITGLGIEVAVGAEVVLPFEGVLRMAFPHPGFTPCTWVTMVTRDDVIERAGALSAAKLDEIEDALRACEEPKDWTPATAAKFGDIKQAVRRGAFK
ncbi:type II toxin-antitoxin system PemK/MazF family toxin [Sphaerisporangium sp. NPDC051011]|uniref:type II toxin-antitoxin system PemK/MazF family toxin n=1 Tax=Sphaerisporangium sp. NPDC051011 TaxID=3155792 RepID=UPI0033E66632